MKTAYDAGIANNVQNADVQIAVEMAGGNQVADTKVLAPGEMITVTMTITPDANYKLPDGIVAPTLRTVQCKKQ